MTQVGAKRVACPGDRLRPGDSVNRRAILSRAKAINHLSHSTTQQADQTHHQHQHPPTHQTTSQCRRLLALPWSCARRTN